MKILILLIWIAVYFVYSFLNTPIYKIHDYDIDKTISFIGNSITFEKSDIEEIRHSQFKVNSFSWDGLYWAIIKLTDKWKEKIVQEKKSNIWKFDLKKINDIERCSIINYHNDKKIELNLDYVNNKYYYVSKTQEYGWYIKMYFDEQNNMFYYCLFR